MNSLFFSVNPNPQHLLSGNLVQFCFLFLIGVILAVSAYFILRRFAFRQAWMIAVLIVVVMTVFAYQQNFSGFYRMDFKERDIQLQYFYPRRTITFSKKEIKSFKQVKSFRNMGYMVLEDAKGRKFKSNKLYAWTLRQNYQKFQELLIARKK